MSPCLYDSTETQFTTNGIGKLADVRSCTVEEKRNGSYELKMTYPSSGIHAEDIAENNIILAKPSVTGSEQPFRIYKVTTPLTGLLEVQARHISYQLNFITVSPFSVTGCASALSGLKSHAAESCPFSFETDISSTANFKLSVPASLRNCLGGMDGSMLDTYGGEYEWDRYKVILHKSRGKDHGVRIVYGKNLTDFKMERSIENVITGVHPYWKSSEGDTVVELSEKIVTTESTSPYQKITVLDCSSQYQEQPTEAQIRSYAQSYLKDTSLTDPDIDIIIDFIQLWNTPGYEDVAQAEEVSLCDTVHLYVSKLGVEVSSKVTELVYDVLLERYKSVTLSNSTVSSRNTSLTASLNGIRNTANDAYLLAAKAESNASAGVQEMSDCCKMDSTLLSGLFGLYYKGETVEGKAVRYAYNAQTLSSSSHAWKVSEDGFFYSSNGGKSWGYAWDGDKAIKTAILLEGTLSELDKRYEKAGALTDALLEELDERYETAKKLSTELLEQLDERYKAAGELTEGLWTQLDERYKAASELTEDLQKSLDERYKTASALSEELQTSLDNKYQATVALTEPETPVLNTLWIDRDASRLKLWDGEKWVVIGYEPETPTEPTEPTDPETPTDTTETDTTDQTDQTEQTEEGGVMPDV